jgi:hypothetical protein
MNQGSAHNTPSNILALTLLLRDSLIVIMVNVDMGGGVETSISSLEPSLLFN